MGGEDLRVLSKDEGKKTTHRYFTARFTYTSAHGDDEVSERYGEVLKIITLRLANREFHLVQARWFSDAAACVDLDTETPRLRTDLAWDATTERLVEAKNITNIVLPVEVPWDVMGRSTVVLDRSFDTLLIPE